MMPVIWSSITIVPTVVPTVVPIGLVDVGSYGL
jgi:hypothetical protein